MPLPPISPLVITWQLLVLLYLMASFVLTVMTFCFPDLILKQVLFAYFDPIMVAVLALDIIITLNICIIHKGQIINSRKQIFVNYVTSVYFWVDLLSLTLSLVQLGYNAIQDFTPAYNFIVFIKIIKAFRLDNLIQRYGIKSFIAMIFYQLAKNIIFLALINHLVGCFAFYLDTWAYNSNQYDGDPSDFWILTSDAYSNIVGQDLWVRYVYCFYFSASLVSGVAYGDLIPQNPISTAYVFFILFLPIVIYSYIFSVVYSVFAKKRQKNSSIKKSISLVNKHLETLQVKQKLQNKLITYLTYYLKKSNESKQFIQTMAPSIRKAYVNRQKQARFNFMIFQQMLDTSPLTDRQGFKNELMDVMVQQSFPERYKLIMPHRVKLYFINEGICQRIVKTSTKYCDNIGVGQYVGFYNFLTGLTTPKLKYQSASYVTAYSIERKSFISMLQNQRFYELKQAFYLLRQEKILYGNPTVNGQACFFCNSKEHYLDRCPSLQPYKSQQKQQIYMHSRMKVRRHTKRLKKIKVFHKNTQKHPQSTQKAQISIQCDMTDNPISQSRPFQTFLHTRVYYSQYNSLSLTVSQFL